MTRQFSERELYAVMTEAAGDVTGVDLATSSDTSFDDLGYDSLAVLEIQSQIRRTYGVRIPDEQMDSLTTPRAMAAFVSGRIADE